MAPELDNDEQREADQAQDVADDALVVDRKSTRLNSSHRT